MQCKCFHELCRECSSYERSKLFALTSSEAFGVPTLRAKRTELMTSGARKFDFSKAIVPYSQASSPQCFFLLQLRQSSLLTPNLKREIYPAPDLIYYYELSQGDLRTTL
uniref:Uncharacterized protein n=1 Tax=Phlegmariurus squarrosus TaxID=73615 RepID=H9M877_PHLSQ|nr:hypothetical protein HusqMp102 [Phlegmariurus squarrosus]AEV55784.1 hypothetical protein HusqMp102 [Phlegmariurus squarrosus]